MTGDRRARVRRPMPFLLVRHRDMTGVSGTGIVAEGVEWSDSSASLRWRGDHPTTTFFQTGLGGVRTIHGHQGNTDVIYLDCPSDARGFAGSCVDGLCGRCGAAWPCVRCPAP